MINMIKTLEKCRKDEIHKIENYDKALNDKTQTWECHHRLELTLDGEFAHTSDELDRLGMYKNRPYFELIFLTKKEHQDLHSEANKTNSIRNLRISNSKKGKKCPWMSKQNKIVFTGKKPWNAGMSGITHVEEERKERYRKLYKGKHWRLVNGKREWYE